MRSVPRVLLVLSFAVPVGCTVHTIPAQSTVYALSLIHISEPTRPY